MLEKGRYISGDLNDRDNYNEKYNFANTLLKTDYSLYEIDTLSISILNSIDVKEVKDTRAQNVEFLYEKLISKPLLKFLFLKTDKKDCLLFLPIILESQEERNKLRAY
jgi:hypothetical protein